MSITEDQNILNDSTVTVTALQNQFERSGTKRIALELYPQEDLSEGTGTFPTGSNLTVTVPTRLYGETYWDDELAGEDGYEGVDNNASAEGIHELNLTVDSDDFEINTVGIRSKPDEDPAKNVDPTTGSTLDDSDQDPDPDPDPGVQCQPGDQQINQRVDGDVAAGGSVQVNRKVTGDVTAGGNVVVNSGGSVDGDVQAGGNVIVYQGGRIGGDVMAGGSVDQQQNDRIDGSIERLW